MQKKNTVSASSSCWGETLTLATIVVLLAAAPAKAQVLTAVDTPAAKRPITVSDVVRMTEVVEGEEGPAWFSPDKSQFLLVLKRGNLEHNTTDFDLARYGTADAMRSAGPEVLLRMSSSSNGDAIKDVRWLPDNRTVFFLGEKVSEPAQVFAFDTKEKRLRALTNSTISIDGYDISAEGRELMYITKPQKPPRVPEQDAGDALIISEGASLRDLISAEGQASVRYSGEQLYLQGVDDTARAIVVEDYIADWGRPLLMAPDGKHAVVGVIVRKIPPAWKAYQDGDLQRIINTYRPEGRPAFFLERYLVLDTASGTVRTLLDAPMIGFRPVRWSEDSQSVLLNDVFLPLDTQDQQENEKRTHEKYNVEVNLATGKLRSRSDATWPTEKQGKPLLRVTLKQNLAQRPIVYVEGNQGSSRPLLDPNPGFDLLAFGDVEVVEWEATDGHKRKGELFKPPDYVPGKRYPLVIQTHGFAPNLFWMDGPWSSAFSARPLAANGFLVLQLDYDRSVEVTAEEGRRELSSYEGAINELDRRGMIDRRRVGITGFSRTVFHTEYALTHSSYLFAAANLVDGMDAGYLQYLVFGPSESPSLNAGKPFGYGLAAWMANSPGFQLGNMHTPVRMQAHGLSGTVWCFWEWFALLSEMRRPVELAYLPGAPHISVKPWDKRAAQEGLVDWFRFWLKKEVDPDPEKRAQYIRWSKLRERAETQDERVGNGAGETIRGSPVAK